MRSLEIETLTSDLICSCNSQGEILEINGPGVAMLGLSPGGIEYILKRAFTDYLKNDDSLEVQASLQKITRGSEKFCIQTQLKRDDGTFIDIELVAAHTGDNSILIVARDVTAQNIALALAGAAAGTMRVVMDSMSDGVLIMSADGVVKMANTAASKMLGFSLPSLLIGLNAQSLFQGDMTESGPRPAIINRGRVRRMGNPVWELKGVHTDGRLFPTEMTLNELSDHSKGDAESLIAVVRDVSLRHEAEVKLRTLATRDQLTGLANKYLFQEALIKGMKKINSVGGRLAVFYVDLDHFQNVNDAFGHGVGDEVIQQAGGRLMSVAEELSAYVCVARAGGDEFHIIVNPVEGTISAREIATQIMEVLSAPFEVKGLSIYSSASVGVGIYPDHAASTDDLLRVVDIATNEAKRC